MTSVLFLMLAFSVMALLLSAILVATSLAATLARQVREIGVMKTVGARTGQLARLYAVLVAALGLVAAALALPAGIFGARAFARSVAAMLNFTLTSVELPLWVFAVQVAAGVIVPLLVAAIPIARAARITVREAIDQQGAPPPRPRSSSLPLAVRNALRRPARLLLTMTLLSAGGAMFMTALDVSRGWERNLDKMRETRFYDVEVKLEEAEPHAVAAGVRALPGVRIVESWGHSPAAIARPGRIDVVRTYPDRGHGSLAVLAPPPESALVRFPVLSGRWLVRGDDDAVVLNHVAARQAAAAGVTVGGRISLSLDGIPTTWRVVGIVEEIGAAGVAYVTDEAFARVTGTSGRARLLRIATGAASPAERTRVIRAIDRSLLDARVGVEAAVPLSELRTAVGDHIVILIRALIAMAIGMAVVGTLGLGSTMSISIVERTRELGVMKAIGATPARIVRAIIGEGLAIALASCVLAILLGIPLTALVGWLVGNLGFLAPLPLVIAPGPMLLWTGLVTLVAVAATWWPARRAAALRVTDALAYT
jgi:putative ABC transport system permease protein